MVSETDKLSSSAAYLVFSADSSQVETYIPDNENYTVLNRRQLPAGGYAWNQEDDDTYNVRQIDGLWIIEQRGNILYRQARK